MKRINIEVNNRVYNVQVACNDETREKGLQNVPSLPKNEGMLFVFDEPKDVGFWMKMTHVPLDIVFIGEDEKVLSVTEGEPLSESIIAGKNTKYVLEVNKDSRIRVGDEVDLSELDELEDEDEEGVSVTVKLSFGKMSKTMIVLDAEGESQMDIEGGERIFSRPNTKTMINMAKRAERTKKDSDYKRLGSKVFEFIKIQDEREPDFVTVPK